MTERFLPAEDPVLESVLRWTVDRDARDVRRLLEWLPEARSSRERKALLDRVRGLLEELEHALNQLDGMHWGLADVVHCVVIGWRQKSADGRRQIADVRRCFSQERRALSCWCSSGNCAVWGSFPNGWF